ncbi:MAG: hypothetical protein WBA10_04035, partial [Elainellaceae cyanobacterium]
MLADTPSSGDDIQLKGFHVLYETHGFQPVVSSQATAPTQYNQPAKGLERLLIRLHHCSARAAISWRLVSLVHRSAQLSDREAWAKHLSPLFEVQTR